MIAALVLVLVVVAIVIDPFRHSKTPKLHQSIPEYLAKTHKHCYNTPATFRLFQCPYR
jgi:hypothetical protein